MLTSVYANKYLKIRADITTNDRCDRILSGSEWMLTSALDSVIQAYRAWSLTRFLTLWSGRILHPTRAARAGTPARSRFWHWLADWRQSDL